MKKIPCVTATYGLNPEITGEVCELEEVVRIVIGQWPPPREATVTLRFHSLTEKQWESMPEFES